MSKEQNIAPRRTKVGPIPSDVFPKRADQESDTWVSEGPSSRWFRIELTDDEVANDGIGRVMNAFEAILMRLPDEKSKGCALFSRDTADGLQIFVSPKFAKQAPQLLKAFHAVESEPPPPRKQGEEFGTALLLTAHDKTAWALLGN